VGGDVRPGKPRKAAGTIRLAGCFHCFGLCAKRLGSARRSRGLPVDDKADLPALVRDAQQALGLHPSAAVPGPDGSDAVKKILGSVSGIAIGLAELRNRGYGTGHGPAQAPSGLGAATPTWPSTRPSPGAS
jgi:hypothetical protein